MFRRTFIALAVLAATAPVADARDAVAPRAPSYSDASYPAAFTAKVPAGASVTVDRACPYAPGIGYALTETGAYRANGKPMGRQHFDTVGSDVVRSWWRYPGTRTRVTFDGTTFRNHTRRTVLVAGWCS